MPQRERVIIIALRSDRGRPTIFANALRMINMKYAAYWLAGLASHIKLLLDDSTAAFANDISMIRLLIISCCSPHHCRPMLLSQDALCLTTAGSRHVRIVMNVGQDHLMWAANTVANTAWLTKQLEARVGHHTSGRTQR